MKRRHTQDEPSSLLIERSLSGSLFTAKSEILVLLILILFLSQAFLSQLAITTCLIVSSFFIALCLLERLSLEWTLMSLDIGIEVVQESNLDEEIEIILSIGNPCSWSLNHLDISLKFAEGLSSSISRRLPAHQQLSCRGRWRRGGSDHKHLWGIELSAEGFLGLVRSERRELSHHHISALSRRSAISHHKESLIRHLQTSPLSKPIRTVKSVSRGGDEEFSELRSYLPSDAIHHIAWRHSAKRGKLLTRVFEDQSTRRHLIAIDLNPLMRIPVLNERRIDIALELLSRELYQLRGEQVGVIAFDHRIVCNLPVDDQRLTAQRLRDLLPIFAIPVLAGEGAETQDELWERLSDYLEWSGQLRRSAKDSLNFESSLSPSLRLQTSLSIQEMSKWLEEQGYPDEFSFIGSFGIDDIDHRLRLFCHQIGIKMSPRLPRTSDELHQGLFEVIEFANRSRVTELTLISHTQRLTPERDLKLLRQWLNTRRGLRWLQSGCISSKRPSVLAPLGPSLVYRAALLSSLESPQDAKSTSRTRAVTQTEDYYWQA